MRIKARAEGRGLRGGKFFSLLFLILLASLLLLIQACQPRNMPTGMQVKVTRVVSGQTIEVTSLGKSQKSGVSPLGPSAPGPRDPGTPYPSIKVRLIGIDAPDLQQQPWGQAAKQKLEAMIAGKTVLLEFDVQDKDAFGRQLAYIWQDDVLVNEQLVKQGYVLWMPRSPNHKYDLRLDRASAWARLMGQGIWHPEQPMRLTSAEFRKIGARDEK